MSVYTFTVGSITWRYTLDTSNNATIGTGGYIPGGNATTSGGSGPSGALIIPSALNGYTVTRISEQSFGDNAYLTSIVIPDTVTAIDRVAFIRCTRLTSLTIGNSVVTIGDNAIDTCTGLTSITLPNSVTRIGYGCFYACTGLTSVTLGNSLATIWISAFEGCSKLTYITIPASVQLIKDNSFKNCTSLVRVKFLGPVEEMAGSFENTSSNLVVAMNPIRFNGTLYTPPTTTDITFFGNNSVTLRLPTPVMTITSTTVTNGSTTTNATVELTFTSSSSISNFGVGDIVVSRGSVTNFAGSGSVYTATFTPSGQGLCTILSAADYFAANSKFDPDSTTFTFTFDSDPPTMNIASTVYTFTVGSITWNYSLDESNNASIGTGDFFQSGNATTLGTDLSGVYPGIFIPSTLNGYPVTRISDFAFIRCPILTRITLPASVTSIGVQAFRECTGMLTCTMTNAVNFIGIEAFRSCTSLNSVTISNSLTSINQGVFNKCAGLNELTIPNSITSIGLDAFRSCSGLRWATFGNSVVTIGSGSFYDCVALTSVTLGNSVVTIGAEAFYGCTTFRSINIPASVTTIDYYAFYRTSASLVVEMDTKTIGGTTYTSPTTNDIAFFGNPSVTIIKTVYTLTVGSITWRYQLDASNNATIGTGGYFPGGSATTSGGSGPSGALIIPSALNGYTVTRITEQSFGDNAYLTSIVIPDTVTAIDSVAFIRCTRLTSLTIGNSVVTIGDSAIDTCTSLTSITLPNSVTRIGYGCFYACTGLTSVTLGNSLATIWISAFEGCTYLRSITIPASVQLIRDNSFKNCSRLVRVKFLGPVESMADSFGNTSSNLVVEMDPIRFNGILYTPPTTTDITFFGNNSVTLRLPPSTMTIISTTSGVTSGSTTNNATIALTFTSSRSISDFVVGDIIVTRGSVTNFAGSGSVYTATFTPSGQGVCTISVSESKFAVDSNTFTFTFDTVSPSMTITSTTAGVTSGSTTNNASIALRFTSSEATNDFVVGDISVTNGALSAFAGSGAVYTATFTPAGQGACTIDVAADAYTDIATNLNNLATQFTWNFDSVSPSMTITSTTSGVTSGSTTTNATIALTFTSTEATNNFTVGDISLINGTLSNFAGSGTVYTATFTPTGQGACTIDVAAGAYTDAATNLNNLATQFNWTFDTVNPSMSITSTNVPNNAVTNHAYIVLIFTSTESTTNFGAEDITVTNGAISNFAGIGTDGKVYNATFTPANEGACTINVAAGVYTDVATNLNNLAPQFNWTYSTGWNTDMSANHLIKSYVKDFIDVSGSIILRENSNLYVNGNVETDGNLSLNRLFVTADASFNRRIFVGGDVSMNGKVAMIGDLSMNGTVTKCSFNNSSIPKSAFTSVVPDGSNYNTSKIVYDQTFQANDDASMNGLIVAANNVKVSGNIVFSDGTVMNTYDNNILTTSPTVFKSSTFTSLDICGNLVAGSYASSSDYRIKTNIVELDETYTVDKLRPVKYYQTQINREKYGLIAHELQEHYPDLVIGEKDGSELQRVNYTGLIAILINDIKRLKQNLAELESGI